MTTAYVLVPGKADRRASENGAEGDGEEPTDHETSHAPDGDPEAIKRRESATIKQKNRTFNGQDSTVVYYLKGV